MRPNCKQFVKTRPDPAGFGAFLSMGSVVSALQHEPPPPTEAPEMTAAQSVTLTEIEDGAAARGVSVTTDFARNGDLIVTGLEFLIRIGPDGDPRFFSYGGVQTGHAAR